MPPRRRRSLGRAALVAACAPLAALVAWPGIAPAEEATPPAAEAVAWDQAAVTRLANELYESVKDLREAVRQQADHNVVSGQARANYRLMDQLRLLRTESRHLADALAGGAGMEETRPVVRRIEELRRAAAENGRKLMLLQPTLDRIDAARAVIEELEPYYGLTDQAL